MARRKRTNWFAVFVSVIVLISMFAIAVFYIERETEIIVTSESEEYGKLQIIPTMRSDENGSISLGLRYITILENVNVFEHIYENEEIAISDENHTALYLLERVNETNTTRTYQISKIENATFIRILVMPESTFRNLITPQDIIVQSDQGIYSAQVRSEGNEVYLTMTREADES